MVRNVQALRALAALLVVGAHVDIGYERSAATTHQAFTGLGTFGQFGVDIFFVISGFIMVATNYESFGRAGTSGIFLLRRVARIYPLYWIVLAPIVLTYVLAPAMMPGFAGKANVFASIALAPQAGSPLLPVS